MSDIDLDRLASAYQLRPMSSAAAERAIESARGLTGILLDIGGGTGAHAARWMQTDRIPVVIDPSWAMLERASDDHGLPGIRAVSQSLPLQDDSACLAHFHLSIHYGSWRPALDEALRVVSPGGRIEIWTIAPESIRSSSLGRWFPKVVAIDTQRFPDPALIADRCRVAGGRVTVATTSEPIHRTAGAWMQAVRGRFVSTLQFLDDDEIEQGIGRFLRQYPDPDAPYHYELQLTRISTIVQPLR